MPSADDIDPAVALVALGTLADQALRGGDTDAAARLGERAVTLAATLEGRLAEIAGVRFTLARAIDDRDRPRALALATATQDALRAAGPAHTRELAAVDAWLAARPSR